ncbi:MAG: hypothetical protein M0006_15665 [Magnetospirillum sp.]|nr:hypothetical protein [Magnetospirillum sp.]
MLLASGFPRLDIGRDIVKPAGAISGFPGEGIEVCASLGEASACVCMATAKIRVGTGGMCGPRGELVSEVRNLGGDPHDGRVGALDGVWRETVCGD